MWHTCITTTKTLKEDVVGDESRKIRATIVGQMIKEAREQKDMSQEALGRVVNLSGPAIGRSEQGLRLPRRENLIRIGQKLDIDIPTLLRSAGYPVEVDNNIPAASQEIETSNHEKLLLACFRLLTEEKQKKVLLVIIEETQKIIATKQNS